MCPHYTLGIANEQEESKTIGGGFQRSQGQVRPRGVGGRSGQPRLPLRTPEFGVDTSTAFAALNLLFKWANYNTSLRTVKGTNKVFDALNDIKNMIDGMNSFVDWLNTQLAQRDWTNSKLAQKSGMAPSTISMVISRQANPGWDFCKAVASAFGIPPEHVFRRAGLLSPKPESDEEVEELLYYYEQLSPQEQRHLLITARALSEARSEYAAQSDKEHTTGSGEP
jgi:transcriptional regulator with XRE-family HTH domain